MKKLYLSLFAIVVVVAMMAGATMAWFTATDNAGEAVFTAGTVEIDADSTVLMSQFFNPSQHVFLYGVEFRGSANAVSFYEIDMAQHSVHKFLDIPVSQLSPSDGGTSPNGLAFDNANRRLYFSVTKSGGNSDLWFYDFRQQSLVKSGTVHGVIYGATFGKEHYWYIKNRTNELWKASFDGEGKNPAPEQVAVLPSSYALGDVAIDFVGNKLYGSSSGELGTAKEFFKIDLSADPPIHSVVTSDANGAVDLQIAFGSNGKMYGHRALTPDARKWFEVDIATGAKTHISQMDYIKKRFQDVASGYVSVWNPGDCSKMRFTVKNTGSKNIHVRADLSGVWVQSGLDPNVVQITLCDTTNWSKHTVGSETYFYYNGYLAPNGVAELCVNVCLLTTAGNAYQGKTFRLSGHMEAIQASNDAAEAVWGVTHLPKPQP